MSKYYLVDEIYNDNMCFGSIEEIKEVAEKNGMSLEELTIYDTEKVGLELNAKRIIEESVYDGDFHTFDIHYVDNDKIEELQKFLNDWCKQIDTNEYKRKKELSVDEVYRLLGEGL